MSILIEHLEILVDRMEKIDSDSFFLLQKGLKESEINRVAKMLGFNFSDEVYELYTWRNGMVYESDEIVYLLGSYIFHPLGNAISTATKMQKLLQCDDDIDEVDNDSVYEELWGKDSIYSDIEEDNEDPLWLPNWIPIFSHVEEPIHLCTVCSKKKQKSTPIVKIDIECADAVILYDSLTSMIQTFVEYQESQHKVSFETTRRKYNSFILRDPYSLEL